MENPIQTLDPIMHKDLRINSNRCFAQTKHLQFVPLSANEFIQASTNYPIFFIKDRTTSKLFSVALLGLEKDENLFYSNQQWRATYVTAGMRCWPLSMAKMSDNQWSSHIDIRCPLLSHTQGDLLYEGGAPSETLTKMLLHLDDAQQQKVHSMAFVQWLLDFSLLKPVRLSMEYVSGKTNTVNGLYSINETALQQLDSDVLIKTHQSGYLASVYALLASQHNLYDLIRLKTKFSERPIRSIQLLDVKTHNVA